MSNAWKNMGKIEIYIRSWSISVDEALTNYFFLTLEPPLELPLEPPPLEPLLAPLDGELLDPLLPVFETRVRPVLFPLLPELPRLMVRWLPVPLVDPLFSCLFVMLVLPDL